MTQASEGGERLDRAAFDRLFEQVSNWGRFGPDDERGTLNLIRPEHVRAAAGLVQEGRSVSLARPFDTVPGPDNTKPALHYMSNLGDRDTPEPTANMDFVGVDFHGKAVSHLDALCHIVYRGQLYQGRSSEAVVHSTGSSFAAVTNAADGIVGRGVLLDAAAAEGVEWLEPGRALGPADLEAIESRLGARVGPGDIVLLRSGQFARRAALGPWDSDATSAGLDPSAMPWLAERQVAALGGDGDSDARPSRVEGVSSPIHVLAIVAMGMNLFDNLDLERLSAECARLGRYEFCFVAAPLVVPGGTGSPVNALALL
jgi:kynurenine formamidase